MKNQRFDWCVIGAGPAGIAAVGKLIDYGIDPQQIAWVDPKFAVGDFGTKWYPVSSNTTVQLFVDFLHECPSFNYAECNQEFLINSLNPNTTCALFHVTQPLQWITKQLKKQVVCLEDTVEHLALHDRAWKVDTNSGNTIIAKQTILAIGGEPKELTHVQNNHSHLKTIELDIVINPNKLENLDFSKKVAVFGSSHSAIIAIQNLLDIGAQVINYYLEPLRFALPMDGWTLFNDSGLKGNAAEWARKHINGKLPSNLQRLQSKEENFSHLNNCSHVCYTTGFEPRKLTINGVDEHAYHRHTGIIAPGLFGLGIAYPEERTDPLGNVELRVGLAKFMEYLNDVMPIWLAYKP